jgi:hypothetical protein
MAEKDNFKKEVGQTLIESGFKDIYEQKEHKEYLFILIQVHRYDRGYLLRQRIDF